MFYVKIFKSKLPKSLILKQIRNTNIEILNKSEYQNSKHPNSKQIQNTNIETNSKHPNSKQYQTRE